MAKKANKNKKKSGIGKAISSAAKAVKKAKSKAGSSVKRAVKSVKRKANKAKKAVSGVARKAQKQIATRKAGKWMSVQTFAKKNKLNPEGKAKLIARRKKFMDKNGLTKKDLDKAGKTIVVNKNGTSFKVIDKVARTAKAKTAAKQTIKKNSRKSTGKKRNQLKKNRKAILALPPPSPAERAKSRRKGTQRLVRLERVRNWQDRRAAKKRARQASGGIF